MTGSLAAADDELSEVFAALANATRRALLGRLASGPATVNELAEPFDLSLPAVSKHIKVLELAGLVVRGRHAQFRPCALDARPLHHVAEWTEQYRPVWEDRFDRMTEHLEQLMAAAPRAAPDPDDPPSPSPSPAPSPSPSPEESNR